MVRLVLLIVFIFAAGCVVGDSVGRGLRDDGTEQQIRELERRFIDGFVQPDIAKLNQVLAPDITITHSNGVIVNKTQYLEEFRRGEVKYSYSVIDGDYRIRVYEDAAVVTGRATSKGMDHGEEFVRHIRFTRVYINRSGRWRMVALQATRLSAP